MLINRREAVEFFLIYYIVKKLEKNPVMSFLNSARLIVKYLRQIGPIITILVENEELMLLIRALFGLIAKEELHELQQKINTVHK
jgi:hypothetical protein